MRQRQMRSVKRFTDRDGMWNLQARLTPDDGATVDAVLCAHNEALWRQDKDSGHTHDRAPQQRLADALVSMADHATGEGRGSGPRATLNVVIPHTWLVEGTDTAGVTTNGTTLAAETLRRLACDADILPTVLGGRSEVLDVGRALRTATPAQRRGLDARDGGCFNCGAPAARCHVHHIDEWSAQHGCTDIELLVLACHDCHILVHEHGHTPIRGPDGRWTLQPADDRAP
jgi:5-methylcytosine-specific restriction protein A